jgi:hypothetical protein
MLMALSEAGLGAALLLSPSLVVALILGASIEGPAALTVGRVAGAALLALGTVCWFARNDVTSGAARGLAAAMLLYNATAMAILVYADTGLGLTGIGIWPATLTHAALAVWCVACLRKRNG